MKNTAALTFMACLAVQATLGCCVYRPAPVPISNPTPTPTPSPTPGIPPIVVDPTLPPQKFAVLATNLQAEVEDNQLESDFWYDLVLTYCTLLDHGFKEENVFVLYGNGNDAAFSTYPAYKTHMCGVANTTMTDFSLRNSNGMAKDNLCNVLCCLSNGWPAEMTNDRCECLKGSDTGIGGFKCSQTKGPAKLRESDFLFAWVKGHGKTTACDTTLRFTPNPHLHDDEVDALLGGLESIRRALVFETCDAGGWLDNLANANTAVLVSSGDPDIYPNSCEEKAWAAIYTEIAGDGAGVFHGRFTHGFNAALRQHELAGRVVDADNNNLVSIQEGFDEAMERIEDEDDTLNEPAYGEPMHPAIRIKEGIPPCLFIRLPNPGKDHEVFTKDNADDNAIVPSAFTANTPDLWVSLNSDCAPMDVPVKKGINHHLCANVHNIGCEDPEKVTMKFTIKRCDNTGSETETSGFIPNLPPTKSSTIQALWPAVSAIGEYCIRAELTAGADTPISDPVIGKDNNQAMIKITVVN